jgi:hypothetical protein
MTILLCLKEEWLDALIMGNVQVDEIMKEIIARGEKFANAKNHQILILHSLRDIQIRIMMNSIVGVGDGIKL